ncbi:MAG: MBL fold metallo-hydrolase [Clostridia bacterium]|nr:MBL fold metallo-hydrolase [Clostridia bacterium]
MKYGVSIKWLAVASFEIKLNGKTVVTDPYITECVGTDLDYNAVESCDFITLTHSHWDHITDIPRLYEKFQPKILAGEMTALEIARWLNLWPSKVYPMYPNTELDFGAFKVKALYGRHIFNAKWGIRSYMEERAPKLDICKDPYILKMQEIGSFEYRNFLFTLPNGVKILHWGSAPTPEQIAICKAEKPDIAIIQRAGAPKQIEKRADFAAAIGAKVVIPHHHDFQGTDDPKVVEAFRDAYLARVPDGTFITPRHGEWIEL